MHLGQVGEGVVGSGNAFVIRGVGDKVLPEPPSVSELPDVEDTVGFGVVRRVGRGVGILLGITVCDGETDGSTNLDGEAEIVGDGVTGCKEGEIVGILVLGGIVGSEVMIIGIRGLGDGLTVGDFEGLDVGKFEGLVVGTFEGLSVGDLEGLVVGDLEGLNVGDLEGFNVGGLEGLVVGE